MIFGINPLNLTQALAYKINESRTLPNSYPIIIWDGTQDHDGRFRSLSTIARLHHQDYDKIAV